MAKTEIKASEALQAFKGGKIEVQTAKPVKVKGEDGKERDAYEVKLAPLAAEHILAASKYDDGRVVIVTIDGRKHEARA